MLFWRIFLTFIGMVYEAIIGLFLVGLTQWLDGLLMMLLAGALLGAACGWAISPIIPRTVERLRERFPPDEPPLPPPPRDVLRLGEALGLAEGVVVGAVYSGMIAAVIGGYLGMALGSITAALSWQVRRHISLVMLALLLGFFIEILGCLFIVYTVKALLIHPIVTCMYLVAMVVTIASRLRTWFLRSRPDRQEEDYGPHET